MKIHTYIITILLALQFSVGMAQTDSSRKSDEYNQVNRLTIQPAIGLHPAPFSDFIISNLIQWNINKSLNFVSHTAYDINDLRSRNFNYIKTNYNFSVNQKFGVGTALYGRHLSHTVAIMGGIKYDAFSQTLDNPEFEKVTVKVNTLSPDYGLLYNLKAGRKKYFFSFSLYLPVYPYPTRGADINFAETNINNISLEMGVGIRIR